MTLEVFFETDHNPNVSQSGVAAWRFPLLPGVVMRIVTFLIGATFLLAGCGEEKIDLRDENSLIRLMKGMSIEELESFERDAALISALRNDRVAIHGYTVSQVREEAVLGRRFVAEKNREFLGPLIQEMIVSGRQETSLLRSGAGIYQRPVPGYLPKQYMLERLKLLYIENGGDLTALQEAAIQRPELLPQGVTPDTGAESLRQSVTSNTNDRIRCEIPMEPDAARRVWRQITTDRLGYISECERSTRKLAMELGGMSEEEATIHAADTCEADVTFALQCMHREGAQLSECFCEGEE